MDDIRISELLACNKINIVYWIVQYNSECHYRIAQCKMS